MAESVDHKITYDKSERLGSGSCLTTVYKGTFTCADAIPVAVKVISKEFLGINKIDTLREIELLPKLKHKHEHVVECFGVEENVENVLIALELCDMTLGRLVESQAQFDGIEVLWQMTSGVGHLHSIGIIHRDLKPENVLVVVRAGRVCVKIADFGLAKWVDRKSGFSKSSKFGTSGWVAPEALSSMEGLLPSGEKLTKAIDIFVLGILFYYVLTGGKHLFGEMRVVRDAKILNIQDYSEEQQELKRVGVRGEMISRDPGSRPTAQDVMFLHPFFNSRNMIVHSLVRETVGLPGRDVSDCVAALRTVAAQSLGLIDAEDEVGVVPILQANVHAALVVELIALGCDGGEEWGNLSLVLETAPTYFNWEEYDDLVRVLDGRGLVPELFSRRNGRQQTQLHLAVQGIEIGEGALKLLHARGVDFDAADNRGNTVLFHAVGGQRSVGFLRSLIDKGADPLRVNKFGNNVVHFAAGYGSSHAVEYFARMFPHFVNRVGEDGLRPVCWALDRESEGLSVFTSLIRFGADVDYISVERLLKMKCSDKWDVIRCLVGNGYSVGRLDKSGRSLLHLAPNLVDSDGFHELVRVFVELGRGDALGCVDGQGASVLHWVVEKIEPLRETLTAFSDAGVDFNSRVEDEDGRGVTVLECAIRSRRSVGCVSMLIEFGAGCVLVNEFGFTAMHMAAAKCAHQVLALLVENGADVNAVTKNGWTPLHYAVWCEAGGCDRVETVRFLVDRGADVNAKTSLGVTPLRSALERKLVETVDVLRRHGASSGWGWRVRNALVRLWSHEGQGVGERGVEAGQ